LPDIAGDVAVDCHAALRQIRVGFALILRHLTVEMDLAAVDPALQFLGKSGFPAPGELCDRIGLCREKLLIVAQPERCLLDTQWIFSAWKIVADCFEFFSADREK